MAMTARANRVWSTRQVVARGVAVMTSAMVTMAVAGCSNNEQPADRGPTATVGGTSSPTSTIEPQARPAVDAYLSFWSAAVEAQRHPFAFDATVPPAANFPQYSWDPLRTSFRGYIAGLAGQGVQFRGTPPQPRLRVVSVDLSAKPWPVVTLEDCQTPAPDWASYVVSTGKRVPAATGAAPPPYLVTAKVIRYKGRWGVQQTTPDTSRTCTR